jgi:hypothetical protein
LAALNWRSVAIGASRYQCGFFMREISQFLIFMSGWVEQSKDWPVRLSGTPTSLSPAPKVSVAG